MRTGGALALVCRALSFRAISSLACFSTSARMTEVSSSCRKEEQILVVGAGVCHQSRAKAYDIRLVLEIKRTAIKLPVSQAYNESHN